MVWLLVAVGAATSTVLLILVVVLLRHLRGLAASLQGLQEDLVPVLTEIQRGSEEAQRTVARLQDRSAALRSEPD
jgi:cell division protein FtsB